MKTMPVFGSLAGVVEITGDVEALAFPLSDWEHGRRSSSITNVLIWLVVEPARLAPGSQRRSQDRIRASHRSAIW